jgi:hypothetical protein
MEAITNLDWTSIAVIAGGVIFVADRIARLTPTKSDDAVLKVVYRLAAMVSIKVPDIPDDKKPE